MHQIRRILELKNEGHSIRQTERLTGLSRNTIRDYLRRIAANGIDIGQALNLDDDSLASIVYTEDIEVLGAGRNKDERYAVFEQHADYFSSELRKRGVTRQLLWEEYRKENPEGYAYSQFCEHLSRYIERDKAVMNFTHRPGEQLQIDFAGDKLGYVDSSTGEWITCEVLVCALPYSHYIYAEALRSQKQEDFINGLRHALEFIGGVPQSIKCDNMRTAVVRSNRYEPQFTEAMEYMAAHYGTTILTARVKKPRDKGSVEKAVDLSYKHIYAPLRHQTFYSLEDLNAAIRRQMELLNSRPFKLREGSRKQIFIQEERNKLKELPSSPYQIKHVTESKVQRNYHVIVGQDRHQYSVPYTLIGKRLRIIYTADTVEVYDALKRVAVHKRSYRRNGYTTLIEHRPPAHRYVAEQRAWSDDDFLRQASYIGQAVQQVIKRMLDSNTFYEQTYNSCLGILRLAKQYGNARLQAACERAANAPKINFGIISNILKNHLDQLPTDKDASTIPQHQQIRGPQSYQ
jgi:transposase